MQHTYDEKKLTTLVAQVRRDILRMVFSVNSGHPGGSLGCVEYFVALYFHILRYQAAHFTMEGKGEDIFFLSNGHISPVYYSTLARAGFFPVSELSTFRRLNSRLQGHPTTAEHLPGIRIATGSLGQGLSVAVGAALAKRLDQDPHLVYCLTGDGELNEGQIWEAALFAAHHKVDNLIATVDWNGKQIDGDTRDVMDLGNLVAKWQAFGWDAWEVTQGNDLPTVIKNLEQAKKHTGKGKPVCLLLRTIMGKGIDYMEDKYEWHGKAPDKEKFETALLQLIQTEWGDY